VVLVPQGGLGLLPLHAARPTPSEPWFAQRWHASYAPSVRVLRFLSSEEPAATPSLLGVVDPSDGLPAAPMEVDAIRACFAADDSEVLLGPEVTEPAVRARSRGKKYVHVASHASYDWSDPLMSSLAMAGGEDLTASEVLASFDLTAAAMVVLSACETGMTEYESNPDEFVGLAPAFLSVGAHSVVSALWAVSDLPTCLMMARLYRLHLHNGLPPARALVDCQRWLAEATISDLLASPPWGAEGDVPERMAARWGTLREIAGRDPLLKPFQDEVYWAAFTCYGTGSGRS
jgi:CHAT domain-containing protein